MMVQQFASHPSVKELFEKTKHFSGVPLRCGGLPGSAKALAAAAYWQRSEQPLLLVTGTSHEAEDLYGDLCWLLGEDSAVSYFPYVDVLPYENISPFSDIVHHRIGVLHSLLHEKAPLVVAPIRALLSRLIPVDAFVDDSLLLKAGDLHETDELSAYLVRLGYEKTARVERSGEFAIKGGILDIFPSNLSDPCRVEFFDIEVESIRRFNAETQRSIDTVDELLILPQREIMLHADNISQAQERIATLFPEGEERAALLERLEHSLYFPGIENYLPLFFDGSSLLTDYFAQEPIVVVCDPESVERNASIFLRDVQDLYEGYFTGHKLKLAPEELFLEEPPSPHLTFELLASADCVLNFPFLTPRTFRSNIQEFRDEVRARLEEKYAVAVLATYDGQAGRVASFMNEFSPKQGIDKFSPGKVVVDVGGLSSGFVLPDLSMMVLLEREIFNRKRSLRRKFRSVNSLPIDSFLDLKPGDFVVHIQHGIGQFLGMERLSLLGKEKDYLKLEYKDDEKLYVPLEMINLVQRYVGQDGAPPRLDTLGGKSWERAKAKVRENIEETARELVEIYSARMKLEGHSFAKDTKWQHEFESGFEFEETPDQQNAIEEVKADMESVRPMDRLICGDVGFGKTEVAIRAAFKAVMEGKQVALLVPTTILAEQHYHTLRDRFELYPIRVEYLNRFRSAAQIKDVVAKLATGEVDVVVGTHRLLSADVAFKNLGLVIIDEEQRFGVRHKEKLKTMRKLVDVLTMTATPIPRTLHLSLIKVRDLSIIRTPPRSRLPVETYVMEFNENIIRRALMQELDRGGQVYYMHNRVKTIEAVYHFLVKLVPHARVGIAHGQLPEHQLEQVMVDFIENRLDILLCTSIIESGLDIPNANTLIVDRADTFGLSQLYQIRGRVGRSTERAYAYLLYPPEKPLTELAQKRLQVINEFTELGSGFGLAMRDMEIRGVGSLFGSEQSGDIITVGFDMYCKLLDEAVSEFGIEDFKEQVDTVIDLDYEGYIPETYIDDERQKIEVYKRISSSYSEDEVKLLQDEVRDRFGPIPDGVTSLFKLSELKAEGRRVGVKSVIQRAKEITLDFTIDHNVDPAKLVTLIQQRKEVRVVPGEKLLMVVEDPGGSLVEKVTVLKNILQEIC